MTPHGLAITAALLLALAASACKSKVKASVQQAPSAPASPAPQEGESAALTAAAGDDVVTRDSVVLSGSASSATATLAWSQVSGPAALTFDNPAGAQTTVAATADGVYVVRLTATEGDRTATDDLQLIWDTTPPVIAAVKLAAAVRDGYASAVDRAAGATLVDGADATDAAGGKLAFAWTVVPSGVPCGPTLPYETPLPVVERDAIESTYIICARATDAAGNTAYAASPVVVFDFTPPDLVLAGLPAASARVEALSVGVAGMGAAAQRSRVGPAASTSCKDIDGYGAETAPSTTVTTNVVAAGSTTLRLCVAARDAAGNWRIREHEWANDLSPPALPGSFSFAATSAAWRLDLAWSGAPADAGGYLLVRRRAAAPAWTPVSGTAYAVGPLSPGVELVYKGPDATFADRDRADGVAYHYALFAYDTHLNYSPAKTTSGTATQGTPVPTDEFGGEYAEALIDGTLAYLVKPTVGMEIFDISNPVSPVLVSRFKTAATANDMALATLGGRRHALVTTYNGGVQIVDVEAPASPTLVGTIHDRPTCNHYDVEVVGTTAYLAQGYCGLAVVDVSDPADPQTLGEWEDTFISEVRRLAFAAPSTVYLAETHLHIVDVSDPADIEWVGTYIGPHPISDVVLGQGDHIYAAQRDAVSGDGITGSVAVINVSDKANPTAVATQVLGSDYNANRLALNGTKLWVSTESPRVFEFDVPTPNAFGGSTPRDLAAETRGIASSGNTTVIAANGAGFFTLDSGTVVDQYKTVAYAQDVVMSGTRLYVADWTLGLVILDATDPARLRPLGNATTTPIYPALGLALQGNTLHAAGGDGGLFVFDVANPSAPAQVGRVDTAGKAQDVAVKGTYVYVADDTNGIVVVDAAVPATPSVLTTLPIAGGAARAVVVDADRLYVAAGAAGLVIYDIATPAAPTALGTLDTTGYARDVAVRNGYAYVCDLSGGFLAVDVRAPAAPIVVDSIPAVMNEAPHKVALAGNFAYVALTDGNQGPEPDGKGYAMINIENPADLLPSNKSLARRVMGAASDGTRVTLFEYNKVLPLSGHPTAP